MKTRRMALPSSHTTKRKDKHPMSARAPFFDGWFIWASGLVTISIVVAYGNIHMGPGDERLSAWNWCFPAFMAAVVIAARCYQYFVQKR